MLKRWLANRGIASVLLVVCCSLLMWDAPILAPSRHVWFDTYQRISPRVDASNAVTIVAIDEATLAEMGQWPWPRVYVAALIDTLMQYEPSVIGLDILFPEADHASPEAVAQSRPDIPAPLREALAKLKSNDTLLTQSLSHGPIVLGVAGFTFESAHTLQGFRLTHPISLEPSASAALTNFPYALVSLPQLQKAARSQALLVSEPEQGLMRRATLMATLNHQPIPGLSIEMLRMAQGAEAIEPILQHGQLAALKVGSMTIPVSKDGETWIHYDAEGGQHTVSARDVLAGTVPPEQLRGKLVLLGLTGIGLMDWITTTVGDRRPGVEVHAQLLQAFSDGRFLTRPPSMPYYEAGVLLLAGLCLIAGMPKMRPALSVLLGGMLIALIFGVGWGLFHYHGVLLDALNLNTGLTLVFVAMLLQGLTDALRQRRQMSLTLQREREAAAKVAGELESARRIQLNSLPDVRVVFAEEHRFQIATYLEPAREVGGDLYDCFMLDPQHLFMAVGDVSGKGVPASLFMAVTRALTKSLALRGNESLDAVIRATNAELARDNPEMLFVTLVAAVLNVETGELAVCNAGHEAPWRWTQEGAMSRLSDENGPPLCLLDDYEYVTHRYGLHRGDRVLLVSDGVTEAMNAQGDLFGAERVDQLLASLPPDTSVEDLKEALCRALAAHVAGAEPSDDITFLVVAWP